VNIKSSAFNGLMYFHLQGDPDWGGDLVRWGPQQAPPEEKIKNHLRKNLKVIFGIEILIKNMVKIVEK